MNYKKKSGFRSDIRASDRTLFKRSIAVQISTTKCELFFFRNNYWNQIKEKCTPFATKTGAILLSSYLTTRTMSQRYQLRFICC